MAQMHQKLNWVTKPPIIGRSQKPTPPAKLQKKVITLDSDKDRNIVNIFYVASYKKYNAMETDDLEENITNEKCKCIIF